MKLNIAIRLLKVFCGTEYTILKSILWYIKLNIPQALKTIKWYKLKYSILRTTEVLALKSILWYKIEYTILRTKNT